MQEDPAPIAPYMRRLLELIARDAPAEEFGAVAAQARINGAGASDLSELEAATGTALRVRRVGTSAGRTGAASRWPGSCDQVLKRLRIPNVPLMLRMLIIPRFPVPVNLFLTDC